MSGRHIDVSTWLMALGLNHYLPLFSYCSGVEDLLNASESEMRDLGVRNGAHRAKMMYSLCILRDKYEQCQNGRPAECSAETQQQVNYSVTSPTSPSSSMDCLPAIESSQQLEHDLLEELTADPSELKSRAWYHGSMSRKRAEGLLSQCGDFLVRDSTSQPGDFVLTCLWRRTPLHFVINAQARDFVPGSLPTLTFQFEEDCFSSVQELIHFYFTHQKPVTVASGAVLANPVARSMPLSYYDTKHLTTSESGLYCTSTSIFLPSPSPFPSATNERIFRRMDSHPQISTQDQEKHNGAPASSLEWFDSVPAINVIHPGGPGFQSHRQDTGKDVSCKAVSSEGRVGSWSEEEQGTPGDTHSTSLPSEPTRYDSSTLRSPPPKPSRIPSIKYKQRPAVVIRNPHLYEDDGRDYTDLQQLSSPPSWTERIPDNDSCIQQNSNHEPLIVSRSCSFLDGRVSKRPAQYVGHLQKGYQTLPTRSKAAAIRRRRPRLSSDSMHTAMDTKAESTSTKGSLLDGGKDDIKCLKSRAMTWPMEIRSKICLDTFVSRLLPSAHNRLLEPAALLKAKALLLCSNARVIAGHVTKVDLEVLRVVGEEDYGVGVTSGIDLCTLPQGQAVRDDVIERWQCQKLWVMTSLMTCHTVTERARLLSQWILSAKELQSNMGNLYSFTAVMEALTAPQVQRLRDTWLTLRHRQRGSAYLYDTALRPALKVLRDGLPSDPCPPNLVLPDLFPVVRVLDGSLEDLQDLLLPREMQDDLLSLDLLLTYLSAARHMAFRGCVFRSAACRLLRQLVPSDSELEEVCRPEFHLRLMWGSQGAGAGRRERVSKYEKLLAVLSERLEPAGSDCGTTL